MTKPLDIPYSQGGISVAVSNFEPITIENFRRRLLTRECELSAEILRLENEARESRAAEVEDPIDQVTSSELKAAAFHELSLAVETRKQVRDALKRMEERTYGSCIDCDRPIEPARLEAVPWTPYCRADQEKHDRAAVVGNTEMF